MQPAKYTDLSFYVPSTFHQPALVFALPLVGPSARSPARWSVDFVGLLRVTMTDSPELMPCFFFCFDGFRGLAVDFGGATGFRLFCKCSVSVRTGGFVVSVVDGLDDVGVVPVGLGEGDRSGTSVDGCTVTAE